MAHYTTADSPKDDAERYNALLQETSKSIASFHQTTRSLTQKLALLGTPQDHRANHQQLTELTDKGNKDVAKINKRLQELTRLCQGSSVARSRRTQVNKLTSDFKKELLVFETTCQKVLEAEKAAVANIRKSSHSFRRGDEPDNTLGAYNEDQLYAQANVMAYDEDGRMLLWRWECRREGV